MRETFVKLVKGGFYAQLLIASFSLALMIFFEFSRLVGTLLTGGFIHSDTGGLGAKSIRETLVLLVSVALLVAILYFGSKMVVGGIGALAKGLTNIPLRGMTGANGIKLKGVGNAARVASRMPGKSKWARNIRSAARKTARGERMISFLTDKNKSNADAAKDKNKKKSENANADALTGSEDKKQSKSALRKQEKEKKKEDKKEKKALDKERRQKVREAKSKINDEFRDKKGKIGSKTVAGERAAAAIDSSEAEEKGTGSAWSNANKIKSGILGNATPDAIAEGMTKPLKDDSEIGPEVSEKGRAALAEERDDKVKNTVKNHPGMGKSSETKPSTESLSEKRFAADAMSDTKGGQSDDPFTSDISSAVAGVSAGMLAGNGMRSDEVGSGQASRGVINLDNEGINYDVAGNAVSNDQTSVPLTSIGASNVADSIGPNGNVVQAAPAKKGELIANPANYIEQSPNGEYQVYSSQGGVFSLKDGQFIAEDGSVPAPGAVLQSRGGGVIQTGTDSNGNMVYSAGRDMEPVSTGYSAAEPQTQQTQAPAQQVVNNNTTNNTTYQTTNQSHGTGGLGNAQTGVIKQDGSIVTPGAAGSQPVQTDAMSGFNNGLDSYINKAMNGELGNGLMQAAMIGSLGAAFAGVFSGRGSSGFDGGKVDISDASMRDMADIMSRAQNEYRMNPGFDARDQKTWSEELRNTVGEASDKKASEATSNIADPATAAAMNKDLSDVIEKAIKDGVSRALSDADDRYSTAKLTGENPDDLTEEDVIDRLRRRNR